MVTQGGGPSPCGQPAYSPGTQSIIYLWEDCASGVWSARYNAGSSFVRYTGQIGSSQPFSSVSGVELEQADVVNTSNPSSISYNLGMRSGQDGIDFKFPANADIYFGVDAPGNANMVLGVDKVPLPFNLRTLGPC